MQEEWRPVEDYPNHEISDFGRLRNTQTGLIYKQRTNSSGRIHYTLRDKGRVRHALAHRLVLEHFVGPPPDSKSEARHMDGNYMNNRIDNLKWGTHTDNMRDKRRHGTARGGPRKFSEQQIRTIRSKYQLRTYGCPRLAKEFGCNVNTIRQIITRRTYSEIV